MRSEPASKNAYLGCSVRARAVFVGTSSCSSVTISGSGRGLKVAAYVHEHLLLLHYPEYICINLIETHWDFVIGHLDRPAPLIIPDGRRESACSTNEGNAFAKSEALTNCLASLARTSYYPQPPPPHIDSDDHDLGIETFSDGPELVYIVRNSGNSCIDARQRPWLVDLPVSRINQIIMAFS